MQNTCYIKKFHYPEWKQNVRIFFYLGSRLTWLYRKSWLNISPTWSRDCLGSHWERSNWRHFAGIKQNPRKNNNRSFEDQRDGLWLVGCYLHGSIEMGSISVVLYRRSSRVGSVRHTTLTLSGRAYAGSSGALRITIAVVRRHPGEICIAITRRLSCALISFARIRDGTDDPEAPPIFH